MNATTPAQPSFQATPTSSRGLVLVVDDEPQNRLLLRDPLEAQGYEVEEAIDGRLALEAVALRVPDVVLLDVMMPAMDGYEVCRRLKLMPLTASVPVLMVTALCERRERILGIAAGANDFLNKPVDLQDLLLRVKNAVCVRHLFQQLQAEQQKSENLLRNILPKTVAERMKNGERNISQIHNEASVLVADIVGFSTLAAHVGPDQIVLLLNEIFTEFDKLVEQSGLEKIKTIGDAYMVAGGLGSGNATEAIAELAKGFLRVMATFNTRYGTRVPLRIGISTGPLVAGVIGRHKFAYDVWGQTVNFAFQLEGSAKPGSIHVDEATYEALRNSCDFAAPQDLDFKGGQRVRTWHLLASEIVATGPTAPVLTLTPSC